MSVIARDFQIFLISGYARRILNSKNGTTNNNKNVNKLTDSIIHQCVLFYNGWGYHVEIPPALFSVNEEEIEKKCHPLSWSNCDATTYEVRRGPNYVDGQKSKSKPSLYTIFKLEGFETQQKIKGVWKYLHPKLDESFGSILKQYKVENNEKYPLPPMIIINILIPNYAPSMGKNGKKDGKGYQKIIYAHLSDNTYNKLNKFVNGSSKKKMPLSPAMKLLSNFITNQVKKVNDVRGRFKVIPRVMNPKYTKFSFITKKLIKQYNGKPFLAKTSTTYYYEPGRYFGIDIDLHTWSYTPRKGLFSIKDMLECCIYDVGFVIEGRENHELPEQILCSARVCKMSLKNFCPDIKTHTAFDEVKSQNGTIVKTREDQVKALLYDKYNQETASK